jgi:peroxiredoxin (alkyl hydroperoxide reductase subunit C)
MAIVGRKFPNLEVDAMNEMGDTFKLNVFEEAKKKGKKVLLFWYPKDFTFVCPTELHAFQERLAEFEERDVAVVACSTDTEESHWGWLQMSKENGGIKGLTYPIVADVDKTISDAFGVLAGEYGYNEEGRLAANGPMVAYRGLFLIDKEGTVQHQVVNNMPLGRSVDEALRMVDALQFFEENGEVCPADWSKGKSGMKESHEGVADYLSSN